jgi:iron complex outermembrane receptor protein
MHQYHSVDVVLTFLAAGSAAIPFSASAGPEAPVPDVVVVSGARTPHASFDLPASIDVVDVVRAGESQMRVNASEVLAGVPGLVMLNRQNYAQDLQISSRGFGARAAFGVRGVRLMVDGIPATMPDGQGQAATFNLDLAERIEVLRGPYSALYGNHAGGLIQLFTRDGESAPAIESTMSAGSDGARKTDINAQGKSGGIGYVLDTSSFETDGARDHSAARRAQVYAKLTLAPEAGSKLSLVASALRQHDTEDPLGVTWATFQRDARAGEIDPSDTRSPKRSFADRYDTRKSVDHQQLGVSYEKRLSSDTLRISVYTGNRKTVQYQAFSRAFQVPATHSGGVVDFDRDFHGGELAWTDVQSLGSATLTTTAGMEYGTSRDARKGYENFVGSQFGVKGALRRDEDDRVASSSAYVQTELQAQAWQLSAGMRHSRVNVSVQDYFLGNGDDGGAMRYARSTPMLGLMYRVGPALKLYASAARGFETPTLNELFYSTAGAGFNFGLRPARSAHMELGAKSRFAGVRIDAALFQVRTDEELMVDSSSGGRTSYRNGGATLRQGGELSAASELGAGYSAQLALSVLRATYREGSLHAGKKLPGVPQTTVFGELAWKATTRRWGAALEVLGSGKMYAEDTNTEMPAPGYVIFNMRLNAGQNWNRWQFKQFIRFNNLFDHKYVGSLIVGDTNKRYYEPAPGAGWQSGMTAAYRF